MPPGFSRGAKMVPRKVKMEAPSPPNGNPEEPKGPAAEGAALKIINLMVGLRGTARKTNLGHET